MERQRQSQIGGVKNGEKQQKINMDIVIDRAKADRDWKRDEGNSQRKQGSMYTKNNFQNLCLQLAWLGFGNEDRENKL